jgi:hypothetical protein
MNVALTIRESSWMIWRVATSTNTRIVMSLAVLFAIVLSAGLYRQFRPGETGVASGQGTLSGEGGGGEKGPGGKNRSADPVDRFTETRIGHVLWYPALGDSCRRILFNNVTGATYDAEAVNCVPSEMNTTPYPGQDINQAKDRVNELSKHFNFKGK